MPLIKGYNDKEWEIASRSEQVKVMDFLNKHIYAGIPEWMQNTRKRELSGYNGEETYGSLVRLSVSGLIHPSSIARLTQAEYLQPGKVYTANDLFRTFDKVIFNNYDATRPVNRLDIRKQYLFADAFVNAYVTTDVVKNIGTPVAGIMIGEMKNMLKNLERLGNSHADAASRMHYRGLYLHAKQQFDIVVEKRKEQAAKNASKTAPKKLDAYNGSCNCTWE